MLCLHYMGSVDSGLVYVQHGSVYTSLVTAKAVEGTLFFYSIAPFLIPK